MLQAAPASEGTPSTKDIPRFHMVADGFYRGGQPESLAGFKFLKQQGITNISEEKDDKANPPKLTLNRKEAGKIALWVTNLVSAKRVAAAANVKDIKVVLVGQRTVDSYLACSPRTLPATLKALTEALDSMKKDGSYEKIIKSYESR